VEQTYLLGVSLSTLLCRDFAVEHPERVKGMIMCGPATSPYRSQRRGWLIRSWLAALDAGGPGALFDAAYPLVFGDRTIAQGGPAAYLALRERFLTSTPPRSCGRTCGDAGGGRRSRQAAGPERTRAAAHGDDDFGMGPSSLADLAALIRTPAWRRFRAAGTSLLRGAEAFETAAQRFLAEVESRTDMRAGA